jgi:hypothetical protein
VDFFISFLWGGGAVAVWRTVGAFDAIFWPVYLGRYMAKIALRDFHESKSKEKPRQL